MAYGALRSTKLVAEGDYEGAITQASAELAGDPDDPEPYFNRGQARVALGRLEEAVRDYETAAGMDAGASGLDPEALDDELFFALRELAMRQREDPAAAAAVLARYSALLPGGRHVADIPKWLDHLGGRDEVWYRDRV